MVLAMSAMQLIKFNYCIVGGGTVNIFVHHRAAGRRPALSVKDQGGSVVASLEPVDEAGGSDGAGQSEPEYGVLPGVGRRTVRPAFDKPRQVRHVQSLAHRRVGDHALHVTADTRQVAGKA